MSISFFQRAALRLRACPPLGSRRRARAAALVALVAAVGAAACSEQLDSGKTCPALCPIANEQLRDTVFDPVALDTTLSGFPVAGATRPLFVATAPAPDSVDVRAVIRFDALPTKYGPAAGGDSVAISTVDSTYLRLIRDTTTVDSLVAPATLEAYDVDTPSGADTSTATLAALFRPDRRIGVLSLPVGRIYADTLRVKLSDSVFAAKVTAGNQRLRIGLRIVSTARAQLRIRGVRNGTSLSALSPTLSFDAATDTGYKVVVVDPSSDTLAFGAVAAGAVIDQTLAIVSPRSGGGDLVVGGTPGVRTLIQFNVPIRLTDSTDLVRAVLELTQKPVRYALPTDTVRLRSEAVLATTNVTTLYQAAQLAAPAGLSADTLVVSPADSGTRSFSLVTLFRAYRGLPTNTMRAVALRSLLEGAQVSEVHFFSNTAPAAVRPRLRLTYVPRTSFGVP